jgi:5'-nucleotidase
VISGHTHRAYNCRVGGRLVTSGDKYGTVLTQIDLRLDPATGDVLDAVADNVIVRPERFQKDAAQTRLIAAYEQLAGPLGRRIVGPLLAALPREPNAAGESALGQVVADAQLAATLDAGAVIALMNPGGLRSALALPADGLLRYEDLFNVQPFSNNLVTMTLSGAQLQRLLEQQWQNQPMPRVLQVSRGFSYAWSATRPAGQRVQTGSLRLNGQAIAPDARLRITVNSFLAAGGDNFSVFLAGLDPRTGMMDIDAFEAYLKKNPQPLAGASSRITRLD